MLVALSFFPAALGLFGALMFWPGGTWRRRRRIRPARRTPRAAAEPGPASPPPGRPVQVGSPEPPPRPALGLRVGLARLATHPWVAAPVLALGVAALGAGAWQLHDATTGVNLVQILPASSPPARAAAAAGEGFAPGIVGPTEVVVTQAGIGGQARSLAALQRLIGAQREWRG